MPANGLSEDGFLILHHPFETGVSLCKYEWDFKDPFYWSNGVVE
jgi:hypothetical protein